MIGRTGLEEAIRQAANPVVLMQRVADEAMALVEGAEGVLVQFGHDRESFIIECASGHVEELIGVNVPLVGSLTGLALQLGETLRCDDAESDPRVDLDLCHAFHVVSVVCVPLWRGDKPVGVFTVNSSRPRALDDRDMATLSSLAEFISVAIAAAVDLVGVTDALLARTWRPSSGSTTDRAAEHRFVANVLNPGAMRRLEIRNRVDRFLKGRGLSHVFQPVYELTSGDCFAVEALARFSGQPKLTPDVWFAEAHEMRVGVELELASVKSASSALTRLPGDVALCVNAGPEAIVSDELRRVLAASESPRIVMELTEQAKVDDYPRLLHGSGSCTCWEYAWLSMTRCRLRQSRPYPQAHPEPHQAGPRTHLRARPRPRTYCPCDGSRELRVGSRSRDHCRRDRECSRARGAKGTGHSLRAGVLPLSADNSRFDPLPSSRQSALGCAHAGVLALVAFASTPPRPKPPPTT